MFSSSRERNSPETLADGMKYFIVFALLAFLAVMFYLPLLRHLVQPGYWEGLSVIPIVMLAEIFMGIYFNLSFWYKLSDQTWWGALMSLSGAIVMIAINIAFVPRYGYTACAWGGFAGYGVAMIISWILGQHYYPVKYDWKALGGYTFLAAALLAVSFL